MEIIGEFQPSVRKAFSEIDTNWEQYRGLVVCGTHNPKNVEETIEKIREARETGLPYYGECFGHQLAAIQCARDVLGIKDATSEEWGEGTFVVKKLPELKVGLHGGESYWNNFEVVIDWEKPENFFTAQYHASYQSSRQKPHKLIKAFLEYAKNKSSS
jgi:CTP synthase (UTP-ammonia lyase)